MNKQNILEWCAAIVLVLGLLFIGAGIGSDLQRNAVCRQAYGELSHAKNHDGVTYCYYAGAFIPLGMIVNKQKKSKVGDV
jgi:hypothetical protein